MEHISNKSHQRNKIWWLLQWENDIIKEQTDMSKEIIAGFICCGEYMVIVKLKHGTHVMPYNEWKKVYGQLHPERWENGKRVNNKKLA